ncbi:CLAVATA3/ESR (CLE)-related protein 2 [Solanum lycopersicum]|uniref:CLAVATA3/ESR (CLE)-related protein 2 n=1 Tax=Solanum lycopersicum TaxID=4081 RepID=UPI000532E8A2|nr:CLAVATA3/ESR (CLE)-related protein 2 [Solanum lycopersicum]
MINTMSKFKYLSCIILLLLSSALLEARPIRSIRIAREALEEQFEREKAKVGAHEWPQRVSPGGPDPHHHFKNN